MQATWQGPVADLAEAPRCRSHVQSWHFMDREFSYVLSVPPCLPRSICHYFVFFVPLSMNIFFVSPPFCLKRVVAAGAAAPQGGLQALRGGRQLRLYTER
jgi:hypothetical protein